ncbi:flagellar protein FliT [Halorhodospira halochloris]|uniref:flagellar protein FliT n=1 Tax=Halorhodospira halochloris TaxID=1052 RepID=UPI001EE95BA0|nr:flagellar protein FliT [Halorhodospira halochloris]MCG5530001.1 flagellar protein FliT [Halorhodospira halochloris]
MVRNRNELGGVNAVELHAERVLELTRQMLRCARQGDWDSVMERDELRSKQLGKIPGDLGADSSSRARQCLAKSLEVEEKVRKLMVAERDRLGDESRRERQLRTASDAYRQTSDGG